MLQQKPGQSTSVFECRFGFFPSHTVQPILDLGKLVFHWLTSMSHTSRDVKARKENGKNWGGGGEKKPMVFFCGFSPLPPTLSPKFWLFFPSHHIDTQIWQWKSGSSFFTHFTKAQTGGERIPSGRQECRWDLQKTSCILRHSCHHKQKKCREPS